MFDRFLIGCVAWHWLGGGWRVFNRDLIGFWWVFDRFLVGKTYSNLVKPIKNDQQPTKHLVKTYSKPTKTY